MVGLLLSCIVSQDNEGVASGADDAGDAESRRGGNMIRRMEDEEVPGTQLRLLISPAREHGLAPSLPHTSICSVRNPEVVRISGRLKGCSCLTIRR